MTADEELRERPSAAVPGPADVEKAARAVFAASFGNGEDYPWEKADPTEHDCARHWAVAALTAVRPSPDSEADDLRRERDTLRTFALAHQDQFADWLRDRDALAATGTEVRRG